MREFFSVSLIVDDSEADAKSRVALILLCTLTLRLMENWRRGVIDIIGRAPDYESTMILNAIVAIGAEKLLRGELDRELQSLANELPLETLGKCNQSSIAAATGLNRETVRRKMKQLEEDGLIVKEKCGRVRMVPGIMQRPSVRAIVRAQLDSIRRTSSDLYSLKCLRGTSRNDEGLEPAE